LTTGSTAASPSQSAKRRIIFPHPICAAGTGAPDREMELLGELGPDTVMMMGDNPALPTMPATPTLLDFFRLRFRGVTYHHLLHSAWMAREAGQRDAVVLACLLHDIANGALFRVDHGYWGAQMVAPYVSEEVAWAVEQHQALRFFPDESVGYAYPEAYLRFFGADYVPPAYIRQAHAAALDHPWYMTARMITVYDVYSFGVDAPVGPEAFEDLIGRHFRQPPDGLGFDGSPVAHMWRSMIWPNNFL
jgi:hypothetical protein